MNFDDGMNRHDRVLLFWDGSLPDLHGRYDDARTRDVVPRPRSRRRAFGGDKLYYVNGELEEGTLLIPEQGGTEGFHPATRNGWPEGDATIGAIWEQSLPRHRVRRRAASTKRHSTPTPSPRLADVDIVQPGTRFSRGDSDGSGAINITDGIFVLNFLFLGGPNPPCGDAADADDSGLHNITDGIFILNFLFLGGPNPPAPAACGDDTTADDLDCATATADCAA